MAGIGLNTLGSKSSLGGRGETIQTIKQIKISLAFACYAKDSQDIGSNTPWILLFKAVEGFYSLSVQCEDSRNKSACFKTVSEIDLIY